VEHYPNLSVSYVKREHNTEAVRLVDAALDGR